MALFPIVWQRKVFESNEGQSYLAVTASCYLGKGKSYGVGDGTVAEFL